MISAIIIVLLISDVKSKVPDIEWKNMPVRAMPVVQNFIGAVNLVGMQRDASTQFVGIGPITMAPVNGNLRNATIKFNDRVIIPDYVSWTPCSATRRTHADADLVINNTIRMPFATRVLFQKWSVSKRTNIKFQLDGPMFRACYPPSLNITGSCGWDTHMPIDLMSYDVEIIGGSIMVTRDKTTNATSGTTFFTDCKDIPPIRLSYSSSKQFAFEVDAFCDSNCSLFMAVAAGLSAEEVISLLQHHANQKSFEQSCADWKAHYDSAFEPTSNTFSGNLPRLESPSSPELENLYDWAASAFVSLERIGFLGFERSFVISEGPSNSWEGDKDMGGSGQFTWDLSFDVLSMSLLDPEATRFVLKRIVSSSNFSAYPIGVPQSWSAYYVKKEGDGAGSYCFDYIASFIFVTEYVRISGDFEFLRQSIPNRHENGKSYTPLQFLERVATAWLHYPSSADSPWLVDYGANKRAFLEADSTYISVVPALQVANAGMMIALSNIQNNTCKLCKDLVRNATNIIEDFTRFQSRSDGTFDVLSSNSSVARKNVRALADVCYIGASLGFLSDSIELLPKQLRNEMVNFFFEELLGNGWPRAISFRDSISENITCLENCSTLDLVAMRADWTATGAYGGLAGLVADSLADLEGSTSSTMRLLRNISIVANSTMPSQGIATFTPPFITKWLQNNHGLPTPTQAFSPSFPEFFDNQNPWPHSLRSIQNAEASIVDSFVRTVFGFRPKINSAATNVTAAIDSSFYLKNEPRENFIGVLRNVRTPYDNRLIDIESNEDGLSWSFNNY